MSLRAMASDDCEALLDLDGEDITITFPTPQGGPPGAVYTLHGTYTRRGVTQDAEGVQVVGDTTVVSVSLAKLAKLGFLDPETLRTTRGITVAAGGVSYLIAGDVLLDRTLDVATMFLRRAS